MSDLNSSVRNEQIDNNNDVADNTEPVIPVTHDTPDSEETGDISHDPVVTSGADPSSDP